MDWKVVIIGYAVGMLLWGIGLYDYAPKLIGRWWKWRVQVIRDNRQRRWDRYRQAQARKGKP
jgi:hypothetical protein